MKRLNRPVICDPTPLPPLLLLLDEAEEEDGGLEAEDTERGLLATKAGLDVLLLLVLLLPIFAPVDRSLTCRNGNGGASDEVDVG